MSLFEDVQLAFAGRYLLEAEIGEGGSAHVFAAQDLKHDRRVAIKILKTGVAQSIAADRFLREIRMSAGLHHPRILPLFDSGEVIGLPYFVMPYVEGSTLRAWLQKEGALPVADTVRIATQVADALAYLHSRGFVHRDVKPENILLQGDNVWLADFGIVRALEGAAVTANRTLDGLAIGTPAYMSPEQRLAAPEVGGQSDQFSLAIVVYEMLVGKTPGATEKAGVVRTPSGGPFTPVHLVRSDIPKGFDEVLTRALQFVDSDRWPSVKIFAEKLADPSIITPPSTPAKTLRRAPFSYVAVAFAAGLALLVWVLSREPKSPPLDRYKIAVLPLAHEGAGFPDGDDCSLFLREAIARWTGIRLADDMRQRDVQRGSARPRSVDDAMRMAKQLGAGLAVWGMVRPSPPVGDTPGRAVHVYLYDVATGEPSNEVTGVIPPLTDPRPAFEQLADSLLLGTGADRPALSTTSSHDYRAVTAYAEGHKALNAFDLSAAANNFRRAIENDPGFALAHLWLAWTTLWLSDGSREWGAAAEQAIAAGRGLTTHDSVHARALVFMRDRRQPEACALYQSLIAADSGDFAAWYGLGECLSSDAMVIPSATSKSHWQFRTSMDQAIRAYERAIKIVPSFPNAMGQRALQRMSRWLYVHIGRYRPGMSADSQRFAAWPSLSGDTLAFIPFSERAAFGDSAGTQEATYPQALQRNRERVLGMVNLWVGREPSNLLALETLAAAREANDELTSLRQPETGPNLTGFAALRRARSVATADAALRLAAMEVRFLIKTDRFREAKALADSQFRIAVDSSNADVATYMYSLAMLTGRAQSALFWGRRSAVYQYRDILRPNQTISPALSAEASDASTFAILGAPADSTRAALNRLDRAIANQSGPSLENLRQHYVEPPLLFAWPLLGPATPSSTRESAGNPWLRAHLALARSDTASARRILKVADSSAVAEGESEIGFEFALADSRLWLELGDTSTATRVVGNSIDLVRTSGDQLIRFPTAGAAFVRLLVLRSVLAAQRNDSTGARMWGTRAWALWHDVDPMIAGVMQPISHWRDIPIPGGIR